ncbi:hypothetical protein OIE52_08745 [Streptomyces canus]|uniref:hypothetical protein n=1 Tax=Streptomyces canus TaxID=58343 RepID=UPI003253B975
MTLAQVEVGAKRNETTHFRPLLAPPNLTGTVVTFDALHSVKANTSRLVETKKAHYIAVIKTNQPTAHTQLAALPWQSIAVQHTASGTGHGRRESRSIKTCDIDDELVGIAFPHARLAIRVHRRRKQTGRRETRESVYAVTRPAPPTWPQRSAGTGQGKTPRTPSGTAPSPRTPPPSAPRPHHGPWRPRNLALFSITPCDRPKSAFGASPSIEITGKALRILLAAPGIIRSLFADHSFCIYLPRCA